MEDEDEMEIDYIEEGEHIYVNSIEDQDKLTLLSIIMDNYIEENENEEEVETKSEDNDKSICEEKSDINELNAQTYEIEQEIDEGKSIEKSVDVEDI